MVKNRSLSIAYLFDDSLDRPDGVQQYLKTVSSWMAGRGHKISFFVGETKDGSDFDGTVFSLAKNMSVNANQNRLSIPMYASARKINSALAKAKPDIVHVQMPYSPLMSGRVIARAKHSKVIGSFHIDVDSKIQKIGSRVLGGLQLRNIKRMDKILAVSDAARAYGLKYFHVDSEVSPNVFNPADSQPMDSNNLTYFGRLVPRKGVAYLLRAVASIKSELIARGVKLVIAGAGLQRAKLENLATKLDIADITDFKGYIESKDKSKTMADCRLIVFPATGGESFGIVLLEAMSVENPVVLAGDNVGYRHVMNGPEESLIDPKDIKSFASRILQLLDDQKLRDKLLDWQSYRYKEFDIENVGPKLEQIYQSVA